MEHKLYSPFESCFIYIFFNCRVFKAILLTSPWQNHSVSYTINFPCFEICVWSTFLAHPDFLGNSTVLKRELKMLGKLVLLYLSSLFHVIYNKFSLHTATAQSYDSCT